MLSEAMCTVGRTLVVIERTVSAIGSRRPICRELFLALFSSAAWAKPVATESATRAGPALTRASTSASSSTVPMALVRPGVKNRAFDPNSVPETLKRTSPTTRTASDPKKVPRATDPAAVEPGAS